MTIFLVVIIAILVAVFCYFFIGKAPQQKNITWGVNFSQMQAETLKLDWKKTYLAVLEDLGAKHIKLLTQWDWVEGTAPQNNADSGAKNSGNKLHHYYFDDIDWQIEQAKNHNANVIYVLGLKTGRWPECHVPGWAEKLSQKEQQDALLDYIKQVVMRYKNSRVITAWQVENEPLFNFGKCPPWYYDSVDFLKQEVAWVKSLDSSRPVIVSDSGEQSLWLGVAGIGDVVGITTYRTVWMHMLGGLGFYSTYPLPPVFYYRKSQIINYFFHKKVISLELQAEPWLSAPFNDVSLQEQEKSMNFSQFNNNVSYAKKMGLDTFYFWGTEWWYWLKEAQNKPEIWNEAKELFVN